MTPPFVQNEAGEWLRQTQPSMLRRCANWDYCAPSIYQITLTLADRSRPLLGELCSVPGGSVPGAQAPGSPHSGLAPGAQYAVAPTPLGSAILEHWNRIPEFTPEIRILFAQLMPEHFHGILWVQRRMAKPLGNAIGGYKGGCTGIFKRFGGTGSLWSEGFQDTILFRKGQLDRMFHYLRDNPRRAAIKRMYPDLFKVRRLCSVPGALCSVPGAQAPGSPLSGLAPGGSVPGAQAPGSPLSGLAPGAQNAAPGAQNAAPGAQNLFHFSAIGNTFLLDAPTLLQVQCSRSITSKELLRKKAALLAEARHGAVLVSPCISPGERDIARSAHEEGLRVIALQNKGFSPLYKPGGKLFDQCASGNLLLLAPAAWEYTPAQKPMTREDACVLNRVAQILSREGAAAIEYHGVVPAALDALVASACSVPGALCSVPGAQAPGSPLSGLAPGAQNIAP